MGTAASALTLGPTEAPYRRWRHHLIRGTLADCFHCLAATCCLRPPANSRRSVRTTEDHQGLTGSPHLESRFYRTSQTPLHSATTSATAAASKVAAPTQPKMTTGLSSCCRHVVAVVAAAARHVRHRYPCRRCHLWSL